MEKPIFTCQSVKEFNELEDIYQSINDRLKDKIKHIIFQNKPFIHNIKLKDEHEDRISLRLPKYPITSVLMKKGWTVHYENFFFSGNLNENQSIEFHFTES